MNNSVKFGVISGLVLTIYSLVLFITNSSLRFNTNMAWVLTLVIPVIFMVFAILAERKDQDGYISFGEAFKTGFIVFLISAVISTLAAFALFQFYSDSDWEMLVEGQRGMQRSMLEAAGADEVVVEEALDQLTAEAMKSQMANPFFLIIGLLTNCFFGLLLSLVPAMILKKNQN